MDSAKSNFRALTEETRDILSRQVGAGARMAMWDEMGHCAGMTEVGYQATEKVLLSGGWWADNQIMRVKKDIQSQLRETG